MNLELNVVHFNNEDVIATSCAYDKFVKQHVTNFDELEPDVQYTLGAIKYNSDTEFDGWTRSKKTEFVYSDSGKLIGRVPEDFDYSLFKNGSYYHYIWDFYGDNEGYWFECTEPSHWVD